MRKKNKKIVKRATTRKLSKGDKILSVGFIIFFVGIFGWFTYINIQEAGHHAEVSKLYGGTEVSNDLVCMVNDTYMGEKQLLVPVDEKDYYGCCAMCVEKLQKNIDDARYAVDPQTLEPVDKATAFIVLKSDNSSEVLYFTSKENYHLYKNQHALK